MTSLGIDNGVVESSSIEVDRRARRTKTDRLDLQKLLTMLAISGRRAPRLAGGPRAERGR
jgi:hypothetical protein